MTTREAVAVSAEFGEESHCYGCGGPLALYAWLMPNGRRGDYLSTLLVPRPAPHATGLPRYGPARRRGHGGARHASNQPGWSSWPAASGAGGVIYVNCPGCDRGQIVRPPRK